MKTITLLSCLLLSSGNIQASIAKEFQFERVSKLCTNKLRANVTIETYEGISKTATLSVESDKKGEDLSDFLIISHESDTLNISNKSNMDINQNQLPNVTITVPESTQFYLSISGGNWYIPTLERPSDIGISGSDTMKPLVDIASINSNSVIQVSGSGDLYVDKFLANEITAIVSGSGSIEVDDIEVENAYLSTSYEGSIRFKKGFITKKLTACNSGSNNIRIEGSTNDAQLNITNSGNIYVKMMTGKITPYISGSGNIKSDNIPDSLKPYTPKQNS